MESLFSTYRSQIKKIVTLTVVLLLLISLALIVHIFNSIKENKYIGRDIAPQTVMSFSGSGEVVVIPDVAEFTYSVRFEAEEVEEAQQEVARRSRAIEEHLLEQGVEERHIKTTGYSVHPRYEFRSNTSEGIRFPEGERVLVGYEAVQTNRVKVTEMDQAGELVGGVGELGASNVSGVFFSVEDEDELKNEARELAIEDAMEDAKAVAKGLGVRLVRVVGYEEMGSPYFPQMEAREEMAAFDGDDAVAPSFSPGEETITAEVRVRYEIK